MFFFLAVIPKMTSQTTWYEQRIYKTVMGGTREIIDSTTAIYLHQLKQTKKFRKTV
jgi:hypothetical protein